MPPTPDNAVRRFQTYLSCQAVTNLRIFPVAQEKGEKFEGLAVLAKKLQVPSCRFQVAGFKLKKR
jgi:hypothetical protein